MIWFRINKILIIYFYKVIKHFKNVWISNINNILITCEKKAYNKIFLIMLNLMINIKIINRFKQRQILKIII